MHKSRLSGIRCQKQSRKSIWQKSKKGAKLMPLATNPKAIFEVVLNSDAGLPKDDQPVFIFRYLSVDEWEKLAKLNDEFDEAGKKDANPIVLINLAFKAIDMALVGWRNMKVPKGKEIPFDLGKLKSMVTVGEATELMMAAVSQRPSFGDKKKFDLPSDFGTEQFAKTVKG